VYKLLQQPGDIIVTFPRAYHMGFSYGWNCAEAANFGLVDWIPHGSVASIRYRRDHREPVIVYERLLLNLWCHALEFGIDQNAFVREELGRLAAQENRTRQEALANGMWILDMGQFCDAEQGRVRPIVPHRILCSALLAALSCWRRPAPLGPFRFIPGDRRDCVIIR
jgi:hypothetical protein